MPGKKFRDLRLFGFFYLMEKNSNVIYTMIRLYGIFLNPNHHPATFYLVCALPLFIIRQRKRYHQMRHKREGLIDLAAYADATQIRCFRNNIGIMRLQFKLDTLTRPGMFSVLFVGFLLSHRHRFTV